MVLSEREIKQISNVVLSLEKTLAKVVFVDTGLSFEDLCKILLNQ